VKVRLVKVHEPGARLPKVHEPKVRWLKAPLLNGDFADRMATFQNTATAVSAHCYIAVLPLRRLRK
jgi:hypothetical protein